MPVTKIQSLSSGTFGRGWSDKMPLIHEALADPTNTLLSLPPGMRFSFFFFFFFNFFHVFVLLKLLDIGTANYIGLVKYSGMLDV